MITQIMQKNSEHVLLNMADKMQLEDEEDNEKTKRTGKGDLFAQEHTELPEWDTQSLESFLIRIN